MKTLLVVDDDLNLLRLYREELEAEGYRVLGATSGEEALRVMTESPADLVLMDIELGGMDGLTTMRQLLTHAPGTPVILNTAYPAFKTDFSSWSADAYVVKSGDLTELKDEIRKALAKAPGRAPH